MTKVIVVGIIGASVLSFAGVWVWMWHRGLDRRLRRAMVTWCLLVWIPFPLLRICEALAVGLGYPYWVLTAPGSSYFDAWHIHVYLSVGVAAVLFPVGASLIVARSYRRLSVAVVTSCIAWQLGALAISSTLAILETGK